jgi:uncharacterized protein YjfI (DUF2170 family)
VSTRYEDDLDPDEVAETLARMRDLMQASDLAAVWVQDEKVLAEMLGALLSSLRQTGVMLRTLADDSRRNPKILELVPDQLDRVAAWLEEIGNAGRPEGES